MVSPRVLPLRRHQEGNPREEHGATLDISDGSAMAAMLALLGLGWNAGVVGGSTMLAASVPAALRPRTEGIGEVAMGLAAGAGAPAAGLIVAFGDFTALSIAGAVGGVLMLAALRAGQQGPRQDLGRAPVGTDARAHRNPNALESRPSAACRPRRVAGRSSRAAIDSASRRDQYS